MIALVNVRVTYMTPTVDNLLSHLYFQSFARAYVKFVYDTRELLTVKINSRWWILFDLDRQNLEPKIIFIVSLCVARDVQFVNAVL